MSSAASSASGSPAKASDDHGGWGGDGLGGNSHNRIASSDPLSQAMSMLDSLNNEYDDTVVGLDDDFGDDFEDFAIDSDGESANATDDDDGQQITMDGEFSSSTKNNKLDNNATTVPPVHWATKQDVIEGSLSTSTLNNLEGEASEQTVRKNVQQTSAKNRNKIHVSTIAHPLQDGMLPSSNDSRSCTVGGSNRSAYGSGTASASVAGGEGNWTSNLASFVSSRVSAVATAATGGNIATTPIVSSSQQSFPNSTFTNSGASGMVQQQQQQQQQQQLPQSSKMSYTERQRLLHEQYYQATNNNSSNNHAVLEPPLPLPSPSSSDVNPTVHPATISAGIQSKSFSLTANSNNNITSPHFLLSPTSPSKTFVSPTASKIRTTSSSNRGSSTSTTSSEHTAIASPATTTSMTDTTFAEKLTSSLDAATRTKLISSALGGPDGQLLPGERVIMFLNMLNDVKDSAHGHTLIPTMMTMKNARRVCKSEQDIQYGLDHLRKNHIEDGSGSGDIIDDSIATTTVWCCVTTFYRVAVFSYQATLDGKVLFLDDCEKVATKRLVVTKGDQKDNNDEVMANKDDNVNENCKAVDDGYNYSLSRNDSMIEQWILSQSVSMQFQAIHCNFPRCHARNHQQHKQRHCVFQMPLASIERVEKTLSSSQMAMSGYGAGIHPSSSYSSTTNPTAAIGGLTYGSSSLGGGGVGAMQLLSSSSSFSSSAAASTSSAMTMSSAMMSLGSQMMPLLGGMASGMGAGVGSGSSTGNTLLTNGSSKRNNVFSGIETSDGYSTNGTGPLGIKIHGKDGGRWIAFSTSNHSDAMRAHEILNTYAFPGRRNLGYLFAFESRRAEVMMMASSQNDGGARKELEDKGMEVAKSSDTTVITSTTQIVGGENSTKKIPDASTRRRFVPLEEYKRQGIFQSRSREIDGISNKDGGCNGNSALDMSYGSPWAPIISANANYGLCSTYPNVLVGPRSIVGGSATDNNPVNGLNDHALGATTINENNIGLLRRCAAFRAGNRLPSLTWGSSRDGGSIWRASQPKVGLQGNRCIEDERYLYAIGEEARRANLEADEAMRQRGRAYDERPPIEFLRMLCGRNNESDLIMETKGNSCLLKIMDLRPKTSAMANRTQGYGYENTNHYRGATINFYGIGNIHAVRDAYQKINALCMNPDTPDVNWMQLVENTNWPSMIRLILSASWQTAFHVHYNRLPVLVHCSHGWDRTSQVPAIAQLLLDPYYRTREGFSTLVEKDFLSFGHPFHTRCGHGEGKNEQGRDEEQLAPIFLQFLDCVFQLVNQFPDYFEFNSRYLLLLSEHIYSCRFGTLLCDTEREREVEAGVRHRTYCLWSYLDSIPELVNPLFKKDESDAAGVLLMPLPMLLRNVTLWTDRYCMYGSKATMPCIPPSLRHVYPHSYMISCPNEQPLVMHTMKAGTEEALAFN